MVDEHTKLAFFNDGLMSGLNWPDVWEDHKPGGPWVPSISYKPADPKWVAKCQQAEANRKAWLEGWEEGHHEKVVTNRVNPMRGTAENARYHLEMQMASEEYAAKDYVRQLVDLL
jgi:hypothetical protein